MAHADLTTSTPTQRLKALAGKLFTTACVAVVFWPGHIVAFVHAMRVARGEGTPGAFRVAQYKGGKIDYWTGDFTSADGSVVISGLHLHPGFREYEQGDLVPARYLPVPDIWGAFGEPIQPESGSTAWIYPGLVTAVWLGALIWAAYRLRQLLRRWRRLRRHA